MPTVSLPSAAPLYVKVAPGVYRNSRTGRYYGVKKLHGKHRERSLGTCDRRIAERRFKEWLANLEKVLDLGSTSGATLVRRLRHVLGVDLGDFGDFVRAKPSLKLPILLTHVEAPSRIERFASPTGSWHSSCQNSGNGQRSQRTTNVIQYLFAKESMMRQLSRE